MININDGTVLKEQIESSRQLSHKQFLIHRTFLEEPSHGCVHIDRNAPIEISIKFLVFQRKIQSRDLKSRLSITFK